MCSIKLLPLSKDVGRGAEGWENVTTLEKGYSWVVGGTCMKVGLTLWRGLYFAIDDKTPETVLSFINLNPMVDKSKQPQHALAVRKI